MTVTILLTAGQSFTINRENSVKAISIQGTNSDSVTVTGSGVINIGNTSYGGGSIALSESKQALTIIANEGELIEGLTISSTGTATANIVAQI